MKGYVVFVLAGSDGEARVLDFGPIGQPLETIDRLRTGRHFDGGDEMARRPQRGGAKADAQYGLVGRRGRPDGSQNRSAAVLTGVGIVTP